MEIDYANLKADYAAAFAAGDKLYLGSECAKPGHGRVRYVSGRSCRECTREKCARRHLRDRSSRTDQEGFTRRAFILGDPKRITQKYISVHPDKVEEKP